ncbi:hypothetical protein [Trujillonella endophytica]|uniref:PknH-like extracellular domain-containing protein n=1 Tax=Trujillonella endophytica TaxID=673521 RepID=A0A1H8TGV3_9ACTN|nr:hypothetical protein [Trujillella endophytica]SEO90026.1 hypothetical protein SAMN05660991_02236 [Trujillella endophytica]
MSRRRCARPVAAFVAVLAAAACGTGSGDDDGSADPVQAAAARTPGSAGELSALLVTEVPSGLARVADADVDPPAGEKSLADVAGYADDPAYERAVLEDYGYRYGWERFWGTPGGTVTSVFVDQFDAVEGAAAYAEDLAGDGADHYAGMLVHDPVALPDGCRLLTVSHPDPESRVTGPAAFAWCAHGVFSVAVSAVSATVGAATDEVVAVVATQLDRLPG